MQSIGRTKGPDQACESVEKGLGVGQGIEFGADVEISVSGRRAAQLLAIRPDLRIKPLRGNVPTRLNKLVDGDFDAIILAAAGLERLDLAHHIRQYFSIEQMVPSVGQGAIGIECRSDDLATLGLIQAINDADTFTCVQLERDLVRALNGTCHSPCKQQRFVFSK